MTLGMPFDVNVIKFYPPINPVSKNKPYYKLFNTNWNFKTKRITHESGEVLVVRLSKYKQHFEGLWRVRRLTFSLSFSFRNCNCKDTPSVFIEFQVCEIDYAR